MAAERDDGVFRASRMKPATWPEHRAHEIPIAPNQGNHDLAHSTPSNRRCTSTRTAALSSLVNDRVWAMSRSQPANLCRSCRNTSRTMRRAALRRFARRSTRLGIRTASRGIPTAAGRLRTLNHRPRCRAPVRATRSISAALRRRAHRGKRADVGFRRKGAPGPWLAVHGSLPAHRGSSFAPGSRACAHVAAWTADTSVSWRHLVGRKARH